MITPEIEVKLIGLDLKALENRLRELGAAFDCEEHQVNWHIASSAHPFSPDEHLRVRETTVGGKPLPTEFTYKKRIPSKDARINEEHTAIVESAADLLEVLKNLGFDRIRRAEKTRRRYLYREARIEFDEWDKETLSYPYAEVEARSVGHLHELLEDLGVDERYVSLKSIRELRAEEGK